MFQCTINIIFVSSILPFFPKKIILVPVENFMPTVYNQRNHFDNPVFIRIYSFSSPNLFIVLTGLLSQNNSKSSNPAAS